MLMLVCANDKFHAGECFNAQVIIWVNPILSHIYTREILPRHESSHIVLKE